MQRAVAGLLSVAVVSLAGCTGAEGSAEGPAAAPDACLEPADATRGSVQGTPVWARFCPGAERYLVPAEVPSDALTSHVVLLEGLTERAAPDVPVGSPCYLSPEDASLELAGGRTYELQIGYADGGVTTLVGATDPDCVGRLPGTGVRVGGPEGLGVYGLAMTAFGRQYADGFEDAAEGGPLVCPDDPREPGSVDVDGASASLDTGYFMGERAPMVLPLTAVRGIVCTWPAGAEGDEPQVRRLSSEEAERVRIGLHALDGAIADCGASADPTHTAVVEDRTGTRRAVTVEDGMCATVFRSEAETGRGFGLGFAWLDR